MSVPYLDDESSVVCACGLEGEFRVMYVFIEPVDKDEGFVWSELKGRRRRNGT